MSEAARNRKPEHLRKISEALKGRKPSARCDEARAAANAGSQHHFKGGRRISSQGYVQILVKGTGRYVYEHRLVMEAVLGRPLTRREVVHHIDDDRANNDPGNLRLFASNAEHLRHHAGLIP